MTRRRLNWRPDLPDHRDWKMTFSGKFTQPQFIDLRSKMPAVVDQGHLGSCTGNGLAAAFAFIRPNNPPFSRLFIYYNERAIEGDTQRDAGAQIRDGVLSLRHWGCCSETSWPYDINYAFRTPSDASYGEAWHHKEASAYRLDNTDISQLIGCLNAGFPFVFGVTLYSSFHDVDQSGMVSYPSINEIVLGGHCMVVVGYIPDQDLFIVRNSWGLDWGDQGHCYFPSSYLTDGNLCDDFWTLR